MYVRNISYNAATCLVWSTRKPTDNSTTLTHPDFPFSGILAGAHFLITRL